MASKCYGGIAENRKYKAMKIWSKRWIYEDLYYKSPVNASCLCINSFHKHWELSVSDTKLGSVKTKT